MRGSAFPSGEMGVPAISKTSLHTPNKYQLALIGPPLLEASINYGVTDTFSQGGEVCVRGEWV